MEAPPPLPFETPARESCHQKLLIVGRNAVGIGTYTEPVISNNEERFPLKNP